MPPSLVPELFPHAPAVTWSDERLVRECVRGNEQAWAALLQKYKNLIFSVPLKYRLSREDAGDVFQAVATELFSALPRLRKVESLRSWLITVATHESIRWKKKLLLQGAREGTLTPEDADIPDDSPSFLEALVREQSVRMAIVRLNPRCQELIRLLFFQEPALPYKDVAARLGLSTGSIGFIRGRCLEKLKRNLGREVAST